MNLIIFRQFVILPYSPDSCLSLTHLWQLHGLGSHWNLWPLLQTCLTQGAFLIQGSPPRSPFLLLITHSGTYSIKPYLRLLPKNVFLSNRTTDLVSGIPVRSSRVKHVVGSLNKYLLNKWYVHVYPFVWSLQLGSKFQKDKLYGLLLFWQSQTTSRVRNTHTIYAFSSPWLNIFSSTAEESRERRQPVFSVPQSDPRRLNPRTQSLALNNLTHSLPTYHCHSIAGLGLVSYILATHPHWILNS